MINLKHLHNIICITIVTFITTIFSDQQSWWQCCPNKNLSDLYYQVVVHIGPTLEGGPHTHPQSSSFNTSSEILHVKTKFQISHDPILMNISKWKWKIARQTENRAWVYGHTTAISNTYLVFPDIRKSMSGSSVRHQLPNLSKRQCWNPFESSIKREMWSADH